jgi:hypothetical protein
MMFKEDDYTHTYHYQDHFFGYRMSVPLVRQQALDHLLSQIRAVVSFAQQ